MSERFFATANEEYDAASWLTMLIAMQRVGERVKETESAAAIACRLALQKPDTVVDYFDDVVQEYSEVETGKAKFAREIGAITPSRRVVRGLNDAAGLLCNDFLAEYIKERTSFARLVPIIDEVLEYCDQKYLSDPSQPEQSLTYAALKEKGYPERLLATRIDADYYLRLYDEPETAVISPLFL